MKIRIVTPAGSRTRYGNRMTALRWAGFLKELGHRVTIEEEYQGAPCDLLLALHARRSAASVSRFRKMHPGLPLALALTGTDLYQDIKDSPEAQQSMELADRLIVLQPLGREAVPEHLRDKVFVVIQSASQTPGKKPRKLATFDLAVVGHLRPVKDPFRAALASRLLPESSKIRVLHVGRAMTEYMATKAKEEMERNSRYHWLGELPHWRTRRVIARSRALVLSSVLEGGANVLSEALADSVPVLASHIPGSIGLLGKAYPGYYPTENTEALAALMSRTEMDREFYKQLEEWCAALSPTFQPKGERNALDTLLRELAPTRP